MGRSAVRVVVRMRPTDHYAANLVCLQEDQKTITVQTSRRSGVGAGDASAAVDSHAYKMDQVFQDASQEAIYDACAADIVKAVVAGYNGTVMAYGQTGAGKTYTMMGGTDYRTRGVLPRAIKAVFEEVSTQVDKQFEVRVSYVEVYNDRICDLLAPNADADVTIQEDAKGSVTIRGATHTLCTNEAEALGCLFTGNSNRAVAEHTLNASSSRSHCIFTVHVTSRSRVESESASLVGKLHCVDLAGSERLSKTESGGALLREAQFINKSLTFLEQVVMALGAANRHVPFRQSKLTNILKDSLGGNSKTTMIANVWPEERHMEETVSTLKFAARMMRVQTEASVNQILDAETHIKQLQRKISDLKAELQMQNQLMGKSHIAYEGEIGEDERFEMEKTVKAYITNKTADIEVRSLREVKEYFRIFKAFVDSKDVEIRDGADPRLASPTAAVPASPTTKTGAASAAPAASPAARAPAQDAGVGVVDHTSGQSVGVAAPAKSIREVVRGPTAAAALAGGHAPGASALPSPSKNGPNASGLDDSASEYLSPASATHAAAPPNRNAAFADYKLGEGSKLAHALRDHQEALQAKRKLAADLSVKVNEAKAVIDVMAQQLDQRRMDRQARGEEEVVDHEEFEIVKALKAKKGEYRQLYEELSTAKTARDHLVRLVDHAKQQLLSSFDAWFEHSFANGSGTVGGGVTVAGGAAWRGGAAGRARGGGGRGAAEDDDDQLDEGERFEMLELNRVMDEDPDSVAYYQAKKLTATQKAAAGGSTVRRPKHVASPPRRR